MLKLVGLAAVKNEEDIIELFVRHNLKYVDELHLIDNGSNDNTLTIISLLQQEGLPIHFTQSDHSAADHAKVISLYARLFNSADFIFFLDADEFIVAPSKMFIDLELKKIKIGEAGRIDWQTYVPLKNLTSKKYLEEIDHRKKNEDFKYGKVIVPGKMISKVMIALGNHYAVDSQGRELPMTSLNFNLAHFPIRSSDQVITKVILGSHVLSLSKSLPKDQAFHWYEIAGKIREANYVISDQMLCDLALNFERAATNRDLERSPLERLPGVEIKYPHLQNTHLLKKFDFFAADLVKRIHANDEG